EILGNVISPFDAALQHDLCIRDVVGLGAAMTRKMEKIERIWILQCLSHGGGPRRDFRGLKLGFHELSFRRHLPEDVCRMWVVRDHVPHPSGPNAYAGWRPTSLVKPSDHAHLREEMHVSSQRFARLFEMHQLPGDGRLC